MQMRACRAGGTNQEPRTHLPADHDEITGIANYLDQQLAAIRSSAIGLTEEHATSTPCRSTLSVAGTVRHVIHEGARCDPVLPARRPVPIDCSVMAAAHLDTFVLSGDETVAGLLADLDTGQWHGSFDERPIRQRFVRRSTASASVHWS